MFQTALANPLDKFTLGIKAFIEDLMLRRLGEKDRSLISYTDDQAFQNEALTVLARAIFEGVRERGDGKVTPALCLGSRTVALAVFAAAVFGKRFCGSSAGNRCAGGERKASGG